MGTKEPEINRYMQLAGKILSRLDAQQISVPAENLLALPEKVLQFGTGVLLRGLPDYFIDKANKQGLFNGRIVVVKSTGNGDTLDFDKQDGLYTLLEKGVVNGVVVERASVNASISRVLSAADQWDTILACAANPSMQSILSNTTEIGIIFHEPDAHAVKPVSFPGRVLVFLEERYRVFNGSSEAGMVIVPTELIIDNGTRLKEIVTELARLKGLSDAFMHWLDTANEFCNSLVDCIVPGKLPAAEQILTETKLGYQDALLIMSEPYRLWAIETKQERTRHILSFSGCDEGVVLSDDINKFRELKLRLLNATHTLSCGLAYLAGFITVKEAMQDASFKAFTAELMYDEIVPLVVSKGISLEEASQFASQVIDRFTNPYIEHPWLNITMQYSSKMQMRVVSLIEKHYTQHQNPPALMAMGFAAFICFMHAEKTAENHYQGIQNGKVYRIQDEKASIMHRYWAQYEKDTIVKACLQDTRLFSSDLTRFPGFEEAITCNLILLLKDGVKNTLRSILAKKYRYE